MSNFNKIILAIALVNVISCTSFLNFGKEKLNSSHYAVLVAGSNGYWNYRHQADAFHAYHILLKNGMPKENIILFAYDDIANNSENPVKGKVFNKPTEEGVEGTDYYEGVEIDYKGKDVNPENFLAVLEGNTEKMKGVGSGKVLKSTENDYVFINFTDHGAPGLIAFPSGELYADQLMTTFKKMHETKMYKQLVFYLEACESGSMFQDVLPENISIYASSAANASESSWGTYCGADATVNGVDIGSCLGDLYSVVWMEDSDLQTPKETIEGQFSNILKKVNKSHPMEWGDKTFEKEFITDFQGVSTEESRKEDSLISEINEIKKAVENFFFNSEEQKRKQLDEQVYLDLAKQSAIDSRNIKIEYLYRKALKQNDFESNQELQEEVMHREIVDAIFKEFGFRLKLNLLGEKNDNIQFECLRNSVNTYKNVCKNFSEYTLKYVSYLSNACKNLNEDLIQKTLVDICEGN